MSDEKQVTIADVIAEYRMDADAMERHQLPEPTVEYLRILLRRIEDAVKREATRTTEKSSVVANAAAMHEALEKIDRIVWDKRRHTKEETEAHRLATEALTTPPRNCDVGTAEDQKRRFKEYCDKHYDLIEYHGCEGCPARNYIKGWGVPYCQLKWSQMPYEEGGAK